MHSFTKAIGGSLFAMCLVCVTALATLHCAGTPVPATQERTYPKPPKEAYVIYKKLEPAILQVIRGLVSTRGGVR